MGSEKPPKFKGNFLWMIEFVVDDLLITRQNRCAPEEYPTCTEITFRSTVYVSLCDREYGSCVNPCSQRCGKCVMFTLDSPVQEGEKLMIHVYKKRSPNCKFLLGLAELDAKPIFDRVKKSFDKENPGWEAGLMHHVGNRPQLKKSKGGLLNDCACYGVVPERKEQWVATSELTKRMLPLFNLCRMQTGNLVLILRLVCSGPAIISSFPFQKVCPRIPECPYHGCAYLGCPERLTIRK